MDRCPRRQALAVCAAGLLFLQGCLRSPLEPDAPASLDPGSHASSSRAMEQVEDFPVESLPLRALPLATGLRRPGRGPLPGKGSQQGEELAQTMAGPASQRQEQPPTPALVPSQDASRPQTHAVAPVTSTPRGPESPAPHKERETPSTHTTSTNTATDVVRKDRDRRTDPALPSPVQKETGVDAATVASPPAPRAVVDRREEELAESTPRLSPEAESSEEALEAEEKAASRPRLGPEARFQVQIMSTSDPEGAEDMRLQAELVFPNEAVEVVWDPPNYKVRVGGAATMEAAQEVKRRAMRLGFTNAWVVPRRTH